MFESLIGISVDVPIVCKVKIPWISDGVRWVALCRSYHNLIAHLIYPFIHGFQELVFHLHFRKHVICTYVLHVLIYLSYILHNKKIILKMYEFLNDGNK